MLKSIKNEGDKMTSKYIKDEVNRLVGCELEEANIKFPMFASLHEGYAILKEEIEEAAADLEVIQETLDGVWYRIKNNNEALFQIETIEKYAESLACEALQIAAMARKYRDSVGGKNE